LSNGKRIVQILQSEDKLTTSAFSAHLTFSEWHRVSKNSALGAMVYWAVTPCSNVVGYQRFSEPCCFHLQGLEIGRFQILMFTLLSAIPWHCS